MPAVKEDTTALSKTDELRKLADDLLLSQGERQDGQLEAVGYARVSKDPYKKSLSVEGQIKLIFEEAKRRGWYVTAVFIDNHRSASVYATKVREEFDRMVEHLKDGSADVLAYWESSRASRDLEVYVPMRKLSKKLGLKWHYNGNTYDFTNYDDQFRTALDVVLSEREVEQMRARVKGGIERAAKMGIPHGGPCPYGYLRRHDATGLISQDLDETPRVTTATADLAEDEQILFTPVEIVKEIYDRLAAGDSCWNVMKDLNVRGIPAVRGKWTTRTIRTIATSQVYIGWRTHKGTRTARGMWPAIIEDETVFDTLQVRLTDPARKKSRSNKAVNLLSCLARCGECGGNLGTNRKEKALKGGLGYKTYVCRGRGDGTGPTACVSIRCEKLDAYVEEIIITRLSDPSALEWLVRPDDSGAAKAAEEAAALRAQVERYKAKAANGQMDVDDYLEITAGLKKKAADLETKAAPEWIPPTVRELAGEQAQQVWDGLSIAAKRDIIRCILSIGLMKGGVGRRPFDPARVRLEWLLDNGRPANRKDKRRPAVRKDKVTRSAS